MDWIPLNFDLMRHPLNWAIVGLMVMIAVLGISLVFPGAGGAKTAS